ncbi:MAG: ABC transporter ATP-binding protein [Deltaproteobacteria bacterium]|nr:ABC transporter ATP-binding protein [Deltaproteobacteria bacterium]
MALLEIKDMNHAFGGIEAVAGFNLHLEGGELNGLIGPNGAGKTTIFNLVSGFYQPTGGQIFFRNTNTAGLKPHRITGLGLARTFQNIRLWPEMTVLDNIRVAHHYSLGYGFLACIFRTPTFLRREREVTTAAYEILESLNLKDFAQELPKNLPYGLRRIVEIARALATRPALLMLDEPAAGLTSADLQGLIDVIRMIHQTFQVTIWMIEHQMQVVMDLCQYIQCIDFGVTIAEGTPDQIQNNPAVIKAYLGDDTFQCC